MDNHPRETLANVLLIDLDHLNYRVSPRPDLFQEGLGGTGVGIRLLDEYCPKGADPLGPENPIIFSVGPLVGHYPLASKTSALFKSPHTGNLGESHAGGRSAIAIRMAGYGAIVIQGRSKLPVYICIEEDKVYFKDASALWGMRSSYTVGSVIRGRETGSGLRSIMRIGRGGEKQVSYACVTTETYRHFGRLGLGAVFGSKNLKALLISGRRSLPVADRKSYRKTYDEIFMSATESTLMKKYHDLGTAMNINPLNQIGGLPTRNLQAGYFEEAEEISGENLAENYLGRRVACAHCPVACIHLAALRIRYPNDPYFYKTMMLGYDHELIYAMGSMLGIGEVEGMLQLIDEAEIQGLDVMSAGVTLAWATEALEKDLISREDLDGLSLAWGDAQTYLEALRKIVNQPTECYQALARGVDYASGVFGGREFALAFGGNEMPGYHTGPAGHLGYLSGARHSHLDSAGYSLDQKTLAEKGKLDPEKTARELWEEESWRQILSSLVICFFARKVYSPEMVQRALKTVGVEISVPELYQMGEDILLRKHQFKIREGFDLDQQRIPERILETPSSLGVVEEDFLRKVLNQVSSKISGTGNE